MSLRILVVDDHAVVRRGVRSLLESHEGWEVCGEATTGRDAAAQNLGAQPHVSVGDAAGQLERMPLFPKAVGRESPAPGVL